MLAKRVYIWFNSQLTCVEGEVKADTISLTLFTAANPIARPLKNRRGFNEKKTMNTVLSLCSKFTSFELLACSPGGGGYSREFWIGVCREGS